MFEINEITGVIPAMLTLFDANENIDEKATRHFINHLIDKKINGLYLTGSTGEGFLMDSNDRKRYVEIVIDEVAGRVPVIVHIGAIGTKISIDLAKHAYEVGADAISSVPPFYWKFTEDSIFDYYKDIADSTPLPMIVYNVPLAGVMGLNLIERLAKIENVKGIKFTATSHHEITLIKSLLGDTFKVYSGCDEMAISGLLNGADGIIGSFYNIIPELFIRLLQYVEDGNIEEAKKEQSAAVHIIDTCLKYNIYGVMKKILGWIDIDGGYCRRPFHNLTEQEEKIIKSDLKEIRDRYAIKNVDFLNAL